MALRRIECPHCQQSVEVDVTHVTRSRECPNCRKTIILQFASRQKRARRTAVLVPSVDVVDRIGDAPHADHTSPHVLEGDIHHRMMHDPEVRQNVRRLIWGAGVVAGVILLLSIASYLEFWGAIERLITSAGREPAAQVKEPEIMGPPFIPTPLKPPATKPDAKSILSRNPAVPSVDPAMKAEPPPPEPKPTAPPVVTTTTPPPTDDERAIRAVGTFLNAKSLDERLAVIRDVKLMEPILREYYTRHPAGPIPFSKIEALPRQPASPVASFDVHLPDGQKRRATAGRSSNGEYRVDWASFVIYSAMDWDDFVTKRPTAAVFMRVLASPDSRYHDRFPDADWFLCVKLINPLNPGAPPLYGYVQRRSPLGQAFSLILRTSTGDPMPMMLRLKHPAPVPGKENEKGDQVLVEELIGEGWITRGT